MQESECWNSNMFGCYCGGMLVFLYSRWLLQFYWLSSMDVCFIILQWHLFFQLDWFSSSKIKLFFVSCITKIDCTFMNIYASTSSPSLCHSWSFQLYLNPCGMGALVVHGLEMWIKLSDLVSSERGLLCAFSEGEWTSISLQMVVGVVVQLQLS